jgi:predicted kinase
MLWMVCGCPGSGKSSWIRNQPEYNGKNWISRDKVRFSFISDEDEYFSKEDKVFKEFIRQIQESLNTNTDTFADATHLREYNRNKVFNALDLTGHDICVINFMTPLDVCLARNEKRTGRELVPENRVREMYNAFSPANYFEKYKYLVVYDVYGE